jgi:hypothetical protein
MSHVYCNMYFCGTLGYHVGCESFYTRVGYRQSDMDDASTESIQRFLEGQAFSRSYDSAPRPPLSPPLP